MKFRVPIGVVLACILAWSGYWFFGKYISQTAGKNLATEQSQLNSVHGQFKVNGNLEIIECKLTGTLYVDAGEAGFQSLAANSGLEIPIPAKVEAWLLDFFKKRVIRIDLQDHNLIYKSVTRFRTKIKLSPIELCSKKQLRNSDSIEIRKGIPKPWGYHGGGGKPSVIP